ncbi:hypothetical protein [Dyadobacter sp. NIV53]|uniref:hypothetical protein n=1 Tax=Dyadobacter sp. NIV53 TaxID=2861765 RepID=UPI001E4ED603|nr:hypothetical protein [Dyadobacter sp. NIV53]
MTQIKKLIKKSPISELRSSFENFITTYTNKHSDVFEALSRQAVPFGGNLLEKGHYVKDNRTSDNTKEQTNGHTQEVAENRYSVLYTLNAQYHHIGCSSQAEAQSVMGLLMTDGNRIPVGIYDEKTDSFEWEIIGQYFHSQDPISEQHSRMDEILTIARALRRRDSSWQPGYLQKPSFFA